MEYRALGADIYSHTEKRVDEGNAVRALRFNCLCYFSNIGDVRGQFHDKRLGCRRSHRLCYGSRALAGNAPCRAACLDIRAGDVQFYHVNVGAVQSLRRRDVVVNSSARNVRDDNVALLLEGREIVVDEAVNADILESHGVQNSTRCFRNSRGNITHFRLYCHSLAGNSPQP